MAGVIDSVFPVALIVALGALLRHIDFIDEPFSRRLNALGFWVGLPALLFHQIATSTLAVDEAARVATVLFISATCCIAAGYAVAFVMRLSWNSTGSFVQASYRANVAFVGLSVIFYSASPGDLGTIAVLALAPMVPVYNAVAVLLLTFHGSGSRQPLLVVAKQVATNPLFLASLAGLLFALGGIPVPTVAGNALKALGQMALPLALLAIGTSLSFERVRTGFAVSLAVSLVRVGLGPLTALGAARLTGLSPGETMVALVLAACPTATASYIMAERMKGDAPLTANAVAMSTMLSIVPLSVIVALMS